MAPKRLAATAASPKAKAVASPKASAKDKAKGREAESGLNRYFGKRKVSERPDSPKVKSKGTCKKPAAVKSSAKPNTKRARKQEWEVETVKTGTIGSTNSTQSFQTQIVENQGAPFSLPLCATEKPTAGPAAGLQGVQQDRAHTQDVAPCGKFDKFDESSESIAELAEQKLLKPEPSGMPHPLGRIALETIPRPNLESGPAQLCGLGTSIMDSAHHAHESQEAIPTFEASPDLCGDAGDANVCNQSLAPPEFERKIADASGPFCDGARDACEPGSPTHAESLVSATATCNDGAPLDMVLDVQPQPDDVAGVERNSLDNKGCHSDHPELGKHNHCSGQDGCGNGTDRPHDHDCSDEQDQQVDKSGNCNSPHVCADRKCEQGVKNTGSVNQPGAQELEATERKRILTRMFRWPFSVMDILYNFAKHPLNHLVQKSKEAAVQVACSVRQHVHDALAAEATGTPSRMFGSEFSSAEPDMARTEFFRELVSHIEGVSMSTCFSGVDTPATSYMGLAWAACREGGFDLDKLPQPRNMFAIEKFSKSIEQLEAHPHPAEHIFDDVEAFWSPAVAERLAKTQSLSEDFIETVIVPAVLSGHAATDTAFCLKHKRRCKVSSSKLHLAGTPCTDYSVKGEQLRQAGLTFILFLCWVAQRLLLQEDIIVQENVPQFPVEVLYRFFHKLYHVETAIISPYDYGWGVQRRRRWTVMRHKYKTTAFTSPLNLFSALFNAPPWFGEWSRLGHNERTPAWDIFFAASWKEIVDELVWAFGRPESQWKGSFSETELLSRDFKGVDFLPALTTTEQGHLVDYISASAPGNEYQVFSLNQNPLHVDTRSSWSNLQTLIKNAGVMWSQLHGRWLLAREALAAQGFPVWPEYTEDVPMCSFATSDVAVSTGSRTAVIGMAGNAMHCHVCGVVLLYALTQVEPNHPQSDCLRDPALSALAAALEADFDFDFH